MVRFGDSDAAGVIHFHNVLRWCHESWEESLQNYGIFSCDVFPGSRSSLEDLSVVLPIVHCEADFFKPIKTGDALLVKLVPKRIDLSSFQIETNFYCQHHFVARGLVRHIAIKSKTSERYPLPELIDLWLEASSLNLGTSTI